MGDARIDAGHGSKSTGTQSAVGGLESIKLHTALAAV